MYSSLRSLLAALALSAAAAAAATAQPALQDAPDERTLGKELAAVGTGLELTFEELDELLIWRYGRSPEGQGVLREFNKLLLLDALAAQEGIQITQADLNKSWKEFDEQVRVSGAADGLEDYLTQEGVTPQVFREYLRLGLLHERLTRKALGIADDAPLSGEQQTMWLEDVVRSRGFVEMPHPWSDGIVATCGDLSITRDAFITHLRGQLPQEEIQDACYELLLEKSIRQRLPDVSDEALDRAVYEEIARRRKATEADPKFQGTKYEQLLGAQGLSIEALARDPSVRVASLAQIWIGRTYDDEDLREVYTAERSYFDGLFGEAVEVYAIMLKAALFKNDYNPRTFEEAMRELAALKPTARNLDEFKRLALRHSEDTATSEEGGPLGFVVRGSLKIPEPIRGAAFDALAKNKGTVKGTVLGPLRLSNSAVLICLGDRRPAPK
jgi:hypothetical protein